MTTTENIRKELQDLVDSKYQEFHSALVPGIGNILGVRIPQLRILAKEIAKRDNWRMFVEATDTKFYEETMLQGMVIGLAKMELDERMKHISMFVPRIDNWAVCDIFCGELKTAFVIKATGVKVGDVNFPNFPVTTFTFSMVKK